MFVANNTVTQQINKQKWKQEKIICVNWQQNVKINLVEDRRGVGKIRLKHNYINVICVCISDIAYMFWYQINFESILTTDELPNESLNFQVAKLFVESSLQCLVKSINLKYL